MVSQSSCLVAIAFACALLHGAAARETNHAARYQPDPRAAAWFAQHGRQLLAPTSGCACVCAGTHEGYTQAGNGGVCSMTDCMSAFPSCSAGDISVYYSGSALPAPQSTGAISLQSASPDGCYQAIIGYTCAQQYDFAVQGGFIQLDSTSADTCVPGSAQEYFVYSSNSRSVAANGHFQGNINYTTFTLTGKDNDLTLNLNQGCILKYKVTSGGPLLTKPSGKCFPSEATVQTPSGQVAMQELRIGDKVLTAQPDGSTRFEAVFMFSHADAAAVSDFVVLTTESGHRLAASAGHYLRAASQPAGSSARKSLHGWASGAQPPAFRAAGIRRAADVAVGDWVWVAAARPGGGGPALLAPSRVAGVAWEARRGLHNPHTRSGSLLVDGVAALTFTDTLPPLPWLHALLTAPAAAAAALSPSRGAADALNRAALRWLGV